MSVKYSDILELVKNKNNDYFLELNEQLQGLVKVEMCSVLAASHVYDVYSTRFTIQQEVTKHDKIEGWSKLIPNLKTVVQRSNATVKLTLIIGEEFGYLFFSTENNQEIYGVLKFNELKIQRSIELDSDFRLKGQFTESVFYLNGNKLN